jgi:hypothetical protein
MIETMCNEILGNYTKKEEQLMTAAFGTWPKRRINRVMDSLKFEYPDYEQLNKGAEGTKRKQNVSIVNRQAARMVRVQSVDMEWATGNVSSRIASLICISFDQQELFLVRSCTNEQALKEDEKILKNKKSSPEPKVAALRKRKAATIEPKVTEVEEETPSTPPAAEVVEILKVMTESLPIKLLSPLGPELTKLLQKKEEPSAAKNMDGQKKRRIGTIMEAIERTPPSASASKIALTASAEATAEANITAEAAAATETANLESTLFEIDRLILGMPIEETATATEKVMVPEPDKGKKIANAASEEKSFDLWNLVRQELSEAEKKELQKYGISCG